MSLEERVVAGLQALGAAVKARVSKSTVYTSVGPAPGFDWAIDLDYDSTTTSFPEPVLVRARSQINNTGLTRVWWLNESGHPRCAAVKGEAVFRAYGPPGAYTGPVLEVWGQEVGPRRSVVWAIDASGRPRLGPDRVIGANVLVLATGASVPPDLPAGTVIMRT